MFMSLGKKDVVEEVANTVLDYCKKTTTVAPRLLLVGRSRYKMKRRFQGRKKKWTTLVLLILVGHRMVTTVRVLEVKLF
jgi:hypothetical protein